MEINVTTFCNPHLFWFFELQSLKERELIGNELNKEKPAPVSNARVGEVLAVYDDKWKRAVVKSTGTAYTCWLLDYGVEYQTKTLHKLSDKNANRAPLVKQGALNNTVCLEQVHSVLGIRNLEQLNFTVGSIKRAKDYLESATKLHFSCSKEVNNVHLGKITVTSSNGTLDLTEALVKDKVLKCDEDMFRSAFISNSETDMKLKSTPCLSRLVDFEQEFPANGVGRGVNRASSRQAIGNSTTNKDALEQWVQQSKLSTSNENFDSDEDFCDASDETSSTNSKNKSPNVSFKQMKEAYVEFEDGDLITALRNEKKLKNQENTYKKISSWNEFGTDEATNKITHLNILPSGMLLPKSTKTNKNKQTRKLTLHSSGKKTAQTSSDSESFQDPKERSALIPTTSKGAVSAPTKSNSASESIQHKNAHGGKISVPGCKCEQCVGWEGEDLYFNENKKHFEDSDLVRKTKEIVKPSLLLREDQVDDVKIKSCVTTTTTKVKRSTNPTVLVHGSTFLSPVTSFSAVPFHADIHKALRSFEHVYSVQSYVFPALMRHMNICVIGNRNSGKTMSYLPGICSFELERKERYPDLPQNTISPLTVILCEGVEKAEKIFNTILKLLEKASGKTYVALAVPPVDKKCLFQKQAHILVATPKTLTSLIATRIITMKRLCHFIVEDIDIVLEKFPKEVEALLNLIQSMLAHRSCNYTVQMIMTSERWTLPIEALLKSLVMVPVVCISSYLEAALYGRVDLQLHFVETKVKMSTLSNFLKGKSDVCRTVVICNTIDEINEVKEFLLFGGINCIFITSDMESKDILDVESRWLNSSPGKHFALVCEENVFSHSINITNAVLLVHYSLPTTWTQFVDRFRCLIDNYVSPLTKNISEEWTRCKVHIFVDESCSKQFPKIVQVMQRLGAVLPQNFQKYYENVLRNNEDAKIHAKTKMCNRLKLLGRCESVYCRSRHYLSKNLDYVGNLPKNGVVKFKIVHVHNVTSFAIKLLEHTDLQGETTKFDLNDDLEKMLMEAMNKQKTPIFDAKPGGRFSYYAEDQKYYRCIVRKIVSVEKITKKAAVVSIRCMDTGLDLDVPCSTLYELPKSLAKIDPQVTDVYLANLVPPDSDSTWSFYSKTKVDQILNDADFEKENAYATGQIQLQLGNMMWLKNIMVYEVLETTNLTVHKLNLRKKLLSENLVCADETQLEGLYKACADASIDLPDYNLLARDLETPSLNQPKPEWSYFDDSEYTEIYIAYVGTPSLFYVRLKKFYDLFLNLQKEIQEIISKPFYPQVTEVHIDGCYLAKDPEGDDFARVIVKDVVGDFIHVFFVDYGDYATIEKTDLKHLPNELITKLPFQVIECRLYGVDPIDAQWSVNAIHKFFDFVFEPNTDYFRTLYTTSCKQEESIATGGMKYSVLLVDNFKNDFVIVNRFLIDIEEAVPIKDEDINVEFSLPQAVEEQGDVDFELDDKELTIDEIKKLQEKHASSNIEVIEACSVDDELYWDIQINDAEVFLKNFISGDTRAPSTSTSTNWELPPLQALPPSPHSTPNILWYQTDSEIKISIMLPNIQQCDLQVVRGRFLLFSTNYNGKLYKLNLNFFDNVEKNFQFTLGGPHIKVSLKKKAVAEWPRLCISTQKMRFIKYDFTRCGNEEEKKKLFLDLGLEDDDEIIAGGVVHEIGSDDNYSESDYDSDFED
ncbi:hypothetical protein FQR65_LT12110 [Abscondita terminalis]|nr:hypothetical protein FQR65_LT12110 [Abscondita terminalis]